MLFFNETQKSLSCMEHAKLNNNPRITLTVTNYRQRCLSVFNNDHSGCAHQLSDLTELKKPDSNALILFIIQFQEFETIKVQLEMEPYVAQGTKSSLLKA